MRTRAAVTQLQNLHRTQTPVIVNENTLGVGQRQAPGYDQSFYQQARLHSFIDFFTLDRFKEVPYSLTRFK